jgi:hypothetical protein
MSQLDEYLTEYITKRASTLEKYVLEAYDSKDNRILCIEPYQGTFLLTPDLKDFEFLKDAEILTLDITRVRKGHNRYRVYRLTHKGRKLAEELKQGLPTRYILSPKALQ